jgi:drug/metabolite transporter (DMT)-like permease
MLELVFSVFWVALFLKEYPSRFAIAGGLVIVFTVLAWCIDNGLHIRRRID